MLRRLLLGALLALAVLVGGQGSMGRASDPFAPPAVKTLSGGKTTDPFAPGGGKAAPGAVDAMIPVKEAATIEQAKTVFNWMAEQEDIAFRYVPDGCYARAHLMIKRMQAMGISPGKVWAFAPKGDALVVETPYGEDTFDGRTAQYWSYHCAPTMKIRLDNGTIDTCVIDPSLFDRPVILETWKNAIRSGTGTPVYFTETRFGEAPRDAHGVKYEGSGYWPGNDPTEGLDKNAVATMKKYLMLEPPPIVMVGTHLTAP